MSKHSLLLATLLALIISGAFLFKSQINRLVNLSQVPGFEESGSSNVESIAATDRKEVAASAAPLVKISSAIKQCRSEKDFGKCLDAFFKGFFKTSDTISALQEVDRLIEKDSEMRLICHEVVHSIGRETFVKEKTVHGSFKECNQTCHSGCYHGAMERFLRGEDYDIPIEERAHISMKEIEQKVQSACANDDPINLRFQCLHGLGHAVMFYLDYKLKDALSLCGRLKTSWDSSSCGGGVFMENIHSAIPEKRYLSKTDYHFPCNAIDEKFRSDCYVMQTTRMAEMGLSKPAIIEECGKAGAYRLSCFQSLGRDSSNDVRINKGRLIAELCESVQDADGKYACMRGTLYALADNTWDGKYAYPFCGMFSDEADRKICYQAVISYLKSMLLLSSEKLQSDCKTYVKNDVLCVEIAKNF